MAAQALPTSRPRTQLVTGPHPREVLEAALAANAAGDVVIAESRLHLSDEFAVRITMPTPSVRAARATALAPVSRKPSRFGTIKQLTDTIPFPVVFVIGALFGVIFACVLVSKARPAKAAPVVAQAALVVPVTPAEAAPFVAWAAPPAMPTNEVEVQRRENPPAAPAPVHARGKRVRTTKRASRS